MQDTLTCLSCGAAVDVRPFVNRNGEARIGGRCACGVVMTAMPDVFRECRGYWESPRRVVRVDYMLPRFGPARARIRVGTFMCDVNPAPLPQMLARVVADWGRRAPVATDPPSREMKRAALARRQ